MGEDGLNFSVSGINTVLCMYAVDVPCPMVLSRFESTQEVCTMSVLFTKDDFDDVSLY